MNNLKSILSIGYLFLFVSWGYSQLTPQWKKVADKDGIIIYEMDSIQTNIKKYRAELIINSELLIPVKIIKEVQNYPKWMAGIDSGSFIGKITDNLIYYHLYMDIPIIKNMDVVASLDIETRENQKSVLIQSIGLPYYAEQDPNYDHIKIFQSSWLISTIAENQTKILYNGIVDTYSDFIYHLIGRIIINNLFNTMSGLREVSIQ